VRALLVDRGVPVVKPVVATALQVPAAPVVEALELVLMVAGPDGFRQFQVGAALGLKGVNLKATYGSTTQTEYDVNALMYYRFHRRGYICGTNAPPSSAAQLVARPHKT
jgi:hypothetical protein